MHNKKIFVLLSIFFISTLVMLTSCNTLNQSSDVENPGVKVDDPDVNPDKPNKDEPNIETATPHYSSSESSERSDLECTIEWHLLDGYLDEIIEVDRNVPVGSIPSFDVELSPVIETDSDGWLTEYEWVCWPEIEPVSGNESHIDYFWTTAKVNDFQFKLNDEKNGYLCRLDEVASDKKEIVIPSSYNDLPIVSFEHGSRSTLRDYCESIVLPEGIKEIGDYAFAYFTKLKIINIPNGVTSIGKYAFRECKLLTNIVVPNSVTSIGEYAFTDCDSLVSVSLGSGLKSIARGAFMGDEKLTNVSFSSDLETIEASAFSGCISLEKIEIPSTVTTFGRDMFNGCYNLESITLPFIGESKLNSNIKYPLGFLFDSYRSEDDNFYMARQTSPYVEEYSIPVKLKEVILTNCSSIDDAAFMNCYNLLSVTIPENVETISKNAFSGCYKIREVYNLSSIDISSGYNLYSNTIFFDNLNEESTIKKSGDYYFSEVNNEYYLIDYIGKDEDLVLPDGYKKEEQKFEYSIGQYAFHKKAIKSVQFSDYVISVGREAFSRCDELVNITLGKNIETLDSNVFYLCRKLESVIFNNNLTKIGLSAFSNCNLKSLMIPKNVELIESSAFYNNPNLDYIVVDQENSKYDSRNGCNAIIETSKNQLLYASNNTVIPSGVLSISSNAFSYLNKLDEIIIPNSVTVIGDYAFLASSLSSIVIPENIKRIDGSIFSGCSNLLNVEIKSGFEFLDKNTFSGCPKSIFTEYENGYYIGFENNPYHLYVMPKDNTKESFVVKDNCKLISVGAFDVCYKLKSLTIPFSSDKEYSENDNNQHMLGYIFGYNSYSNSEFIYQRVGNSYTGYTFPKSFEELTITGGEYISAGTFSNLKLKKLTLSPTTKIIGDYAFYNLIQLKDITIPEGVTKIGTSAFGNCTSLENISLKEGVTKICSNAFENCTSLKAISLADSIEEIDSEAFSGCSSLVNITLPNNLEIIRANLFWNCSKLEKVIIPKNVLYINNCAFLNCSSLETIEFLGDMSEWNSIDLGDDWRKNTLVTIVNCSDADVDL